MTRARLRTTERLCLTYAEAADAMGIGESHFREKVLPQVIVFTKPDSFECWGPARLYVEHLPGGTSALIHCICPERKP